MHQPLKGQTALVTGAASGIGAGVARALGAAGAGVVVNYVTNPDAPEAVAAEIRAAGAPAITLQADVSNEAEVREMFAKAIARFGAVDVLVNNAGLQQDAPFTEMTLAQWNKVIGVNLTGMFLCAREAAREMIRRGLGDTRGARVAAAPDPLWPHRPARGHRPRGGLAGLRRRGLHPRADDLRRWRHDALSRVRAWRLDP